MKNKLKYALFLFFHFFSFSFFIFGGSWSLIAQMQSEFVNKRKLLTDQELLDIASIGKSLPGVVACNTTFLFGYRLCGICGGIACVLGMSIPPMLVLIVITRFYDFFHTNPYVIKAMAGIRAAVVPIILHSMSRLTRNSYTFFMCFVITGLAIVSNWLLHINCIYIVLVSAGLGIIHNLLVLKRDANGTS